MKPGTLVKLHHNPLRKLVVTINLDTPTSRTLTESVNGDVVMHMRVLGPEHTAGGGIDVYVEVLHPRLGLITVNSGNVREL